MRDGEATPLMNGSLMNSPPTPEGPGSVSAAPHLPDGFAGTFTSRYVEAGGLRQHVVTGGDGPPAYHPLRRRPRPGPGPQCCTCPG
jgi:hypothetical protein